MYEKLEKYLAYWVCAALCLQRLSMALGSIFWGLTLAITIYMTYKRYRAGELYINKEFKGYYIAIGIAFFTMLPSIFASAHMGDSFKQIAEMWLYRTAPFFAVTLCLQNTKLLKKLLFIFLCSICLDCLVAVGQVAFGLGTRGWGFGGNSLNLSSILTILIPMISIILLDDSFNTKQKQFAGICFVIFWIGTFADKSRGAWLSLAVVLLIIATPYVLRSQKKLLASLSVIMVLVGIFASSTTLQRRIMSIADLQHNRSNLERIYLWQSCSAMIKDKPVIGFGRGEFGHVYKYKYRMPESKQVFPHAHNNYLHLWAETGTIGFLGFMYLNLYILITNFMEWRKDRNPYSMMLWSGWLAYMIFGWFDFIIDHSAVTKIWWFMLGALLTIKLINKKEV